MGTVSPPEPALLLASSATDGEEQDVEHEQSELTRRIALLGRTQLKDQIL